MLSGYKTYIASAISILTAILAYANGKESLSTALTSVPGALLYLGVLAGSLRAALGKVEAGVKRVESRLPAVIQKTVDPIVGSVESKLPKV